MGSGVAQLTEQRSAVLNQTSTNFNIPRENCGIEKTKIDKKRPGMAE